MSARRVYFERCESRLRDPDTYVVLAWVLGGVGVHRFYLGQLRHGLVHVVAAPAGVLMLVLGLLDGNEGLIGGGAVLLLFDLVLWIRDLVGYRRIVEERNQDIRRELLGEVE